MGSLETKGAEQTGDEKLQDQNNAEETKYSAVFHIKPMRQT